MASKLRHGDLYIANELESAFRNYTHEEREERILRGRMFGFNEAVTNASANCTGYMKLGRPPRVSVG